MDRWSGAKANHACAPHTNEATAPHRPHARHPEPANYQSPDPASVPQNNRTVVGYWGSGLLLFPLRRMFVPSHGEKAGIRGRRPPIKSKASNPEAGVNVMIQPNSLERIVAGGCISRRDNLYQSNGPSRRHPPRTSEERDGYTASTRSGVAEGWSPENKVISLPQGKLLRHIFRNH